MKVYIYDQWNYSPDAFSSPVNTRGYKRILEWNAIGHQFDQLKRKANNLATYKSNNNAKFLAIIRSKNYHNEIIDTMMECLDFIKCCLSDEGIIKEKLGKGKIK
jgi:hypothetical protein